MGVGLVVLTTAVEMMYASCVGVNQIQLCTMSARGHEGTEDEWGGLSLIFCHFYPRLECKEEENQVALSHRASSHGGTMRDGLLGLSWSWQGPRLFPLGSTTVTVCSRSVSSLTCFVFLFFNSQLKSTFVGKFCVLVKFIFPYKK